MRNNWSNYGVNGLAHSVRDKPIDDALIAEMKSHGTWQMARDAFAGSFDVHLRGDAALCQRSILRPQYFGPGSRAIEEPCLPAEDPLEDPDFCMYPGFLRTAEHNLKTLADAGVPYGFGTDSGPPGRFLATSLNGKWS